MSRESVDQILKRSLLDQEFRDAIQLDPESALAGFDLSEEERTALLSGNFNDVAVFMPLHCTIRFAMITENIIAMKPHPDEFRSAEFQRRGSEIVELAGDRIASIKEFLALLR
jgi:hypothetical protein